MYKITLKVGIKTLISKVVSPIDLSVFVSQYHSRGWCLQICIFITLTPNDVKKQRLGFGVITLQKGTILPLFCI